MRSTASPRSEPRAPLGFFRYGRVETKASSRWLTPSSPIWDLAADVFTTRVLNKFVEDCGSKNLKSDNVCDQIHSGIRF